MNTKVALRQVVLVAFLEAAGGLRGEVRASADRAGLGPQAVAPAARDPAAPRTAPEPSPAWALLEPGLELGVFDAPRASDVGDSRIRVLRIDPGRFELTLLSASAVEGGAPLTAAEWCRRNGLVAAINASMYRTDHRTSVGLMRTRTHVNNARQRKGDKAVLAFDPLLPGISDVQLLDLECDDFETLRRHYGTLIQNIRMLSCRGQNVWSPQPKRWSTAAIGVDGRGRVLFIHVRSPYATHDLVDALRGLPIDLHRAMYVEGGPEAQLYVRAGEEVHEFVGSFETGFREDDSNARAWPVPNVVGVRRRSEEGR